MATNKVGFVGIGAARSGSTWMASVLKQHPEIFMSEVKEIHYFDKYRDFIIPKSNKNYKKPIEWYHNFFKHANSKQIKGEFTPSYLRNENCAEDIYRYNPNIKLIAILRNPIERTISQYLFAIQWGIISSNLDLENAIIKYPVLLTHSLYYEQLINYFNHFPKNNIKVLIYENVMENKDFWLKEICSFLEIDEDFSFKNDFRVNETHNVKFSGLNYLIRKTHPFFNSSTMLHQLKQALQKAGVTKVVAKLNDGKKLSVKGYEIKPEINKYLKSYFAEDVIQLEKLLQTDLSLWEMK